jgi:hypothetical protein
MSFESYLPLVLISAVKLFSNYYNNIEPFKSKMFPFTAAISDAREVMDCVY